jgi:1-acyl-sn-glycerol-3-phosphate acyltransferase
MTALWRGLRVGTHLLTAALVAVVVAVHQRSGRRPLWVAQFIRWWHERLCQVLEVEVRMNGQIAANALLVSNHISWLDISVIGAQGEIGFLAKTDVREWPLIGWLANHAGTLFIERGGHQVAHIAAQLGHAIAGGRTLMIFPEGTTTDGQTVARFHARLFQTAQAPGVQIQPVAISYHHGDDPAPDLRVPYIGDDTLLANLWRVIRHPRLIARLHFLPPLAMVEGEQRRALAERARLAVATVLENRPNCLLINPPNPPFSKGGFSSSSSPLWKRGVGGDLKSGGWDLSVVTETYPPEINGVANTMQHLVTGLAARGQHLQLIRPRQPWDAHQPQPDPNTLLLVPGLPLPGYRGLRFGLPVYWRLRRHWSRTRPDLIYIATQGPLGHAALAAARALKIPTVTGFHTQFQHYSQHYGLGILTRPIIETLRHFHNRSNMTLVPTAALQKELTASGFNNVRVFGRGVDVERFSPARRSAELRQAWGCDDHSLVVIHVGRIAAEKNLDLAYHAFRAILLEHPAARFVLVGNGPEREHWQRTFPEVLCVGAKVGVELAAHYASGDLFLFPSLTETFGNVVTEAMASGLPVIAFDDAAAHAYITSGHNGVTVPVGDRAAFIAASVAAARDQQRLRELGLAARRTAEDIRWERVLGVLEGHFADALRR